MPVRTISAIFHLPTSMGGLGLQSAEDNLEVSPVMKALKMMYAKDSIVFSIAFDQLNTTIEKRTGHRPEYADDIVDFLNTAPQRNEASRGDVRSLWSMVRKATEEDTGRDLQEVPFAARVARPCPQRLHPQCRSDAPATQHHPTAYRPCHQQGGEEPLPGTIHLTRQSSA